MFVPVLEKIKKINPTTNEYDEFEHYKTIIPKMIANGHAAKRKFKVYPSAYANMYASGVCSGKITPGGKKKKKKAKKRKR